MVNTVEELIQELQQYPLDTKILRGDNSGGYEVIHRLIIEKAIEITTKKEINVLVIE